MNTARAAAVAGAARLWPALRLGAHASYADVEHAPWPLQARVISEVQTLTAAAGLPDPIGPPIAHFSPGVYVRIGAPRRLSRANGTGLAQSTEVPQLPKDRQMLLLR